jgi:predicted dehydrogenase
VHAIEAEFNVPIPYRKDELRHTLGVGGGALMDLGCYAVHWTRTVAAEEPVVQNAEAKPGREAGIDESMRAELNFPGGITAQIACSMAPDTRFFASLHAAGSKGAMTMINPLHPARGHAIETVAGGETHRETVEGGPTFTYQLAHVLDVIGGRTTLLLPPDDGVANMRVIDAIYTAAGMAPRGGRQS